MRRTGTGYIAEFAIHLSLVDGLGARAERAGSLIRFDAVFNDDDEAVSRLRSCCVLWAGRRGRYFGPYINGEPYWPVGLLLAPAGDELDAHRCHRRCRLRNRRPGKSGF